MPTLQPVFVDNHCPENNHWQLAKPQPDDMCFRILILKLHIIARLLSNDFNIQQEYGSWSSSQAEADKLPANTDALLQTFNAEIRVESTKKTWSL